MIVFEGVGKQFADGTRPALASISFGVPNGEIVGLVGPNGAGKTTTLRLAAGLTYPFIGHILIDGLDVRTEKAKLSSKVGWVSDRFPFDMSRRAHSYLRSLGEFSGVTGSGSEEHCAYLLDLVGLSDSAFQKLKGFSRGMLKRFSIACSLLGQPSNFLMDEVFNDLDPGGIDWVRELLVALRGNNCAILLTSHDLTGLESIADRVVILNKGELVSVVPTRTTVQQNDTVGIFEIDVVDRPDEAAQLLASIGRVWQAPDGLRIQSNTVAGDKLVTLLVQNGFRIRRFVEVKSVLKDAYAKATGGAS